MEETIGVFENTLCNKFLLLGKPLLIFANKQDLPGALSVYLPQKSKISYQYPLNINLLLILEKVQLLSQKKLMISLNATRGILTHYSELQHRVENDSKLKAQDEARKRIERERKVLRNKIASAFVNDLDLTLVADQHIEADIANIFTEEEGLTFLAAEIGEEVGMIPIIAKTIAAMVGYQRLALQIVGALKAPISKKKVPMNWEEIFNLIGELRQELNLPSSV